MSTGALLTSTLDNEQVYTLKTYFVFSEAVLLCEGVFDTINNIDLTKIEEPELNHKYFRQAIGSIKIVLPFTVIDVDVKGCMIYLRCTTVQTKVTKCVDIPWIKNISNLDEITAEQIEDTKNQIISAVKYLLETHRNNCKKMIDAHDREREYLSGLLDLTMSVESLT